MVCAAGCIIGQFISFKKSDIPFVVMAILCYLIVLYWLMYHYGR